MSNDGALLNIVVGGEEGTLIQERIESTETTEDE